LGSLKELLKLPNAGLVLALLLARCVVTTILFEITFLAGCLDALCYFNAPRPFPISELCGEAIVGFLGEPGYVGHGDDSNTRSD
jgi:hypothetical protein